MILLTPSSSVLAVGIAVEPIENLSLGFADGPAARPPDG